MIYPTAALPAWLKAQAAEKLARLRRAEKDAGLPPAAAPPATERVLALSDFVAEALCREPGLLAALGGSGRLLRCLHARELETALARALADAGDEGRLNRRLRRFRRREMVRIAWRDLAGWADLEETLAELSALADTLIGGALGWLHRHLGAAAGGGSPPLPVVLALGKLGARELNFSSDVDLVFACPGGGAARLDFYTRLCRRLVAVLGQPTADGPLFRVDLRLRPFGDSGPLVMSFEAMEQYYQQQGRDWERYAWIKARAVAGDLDAGRRLLRRLSPFIYRRYLDYSAYEALRGMKRMIAREVAAKGLAGDIKIGPGGIREIEFFGQVFQLIRGGVVPELRQRRIRRVLAALQQEGCVPEPTRRRLDAAYVFLRRTENHLQAAADQQVHRLPEEPREVERLAVSMGFGDTGAFLAALAGHRDEVHRHFQQLLAGGESEGGADGQEEGLWSLWQAAAPPPAAAELLAEAGYRSPAEVLRLLDYLRRHPSTRALSSAGRQRLDRLMPVLLAEIGRSSAPETTLARVVDLVRSIERRANYLALLLEQPAVRRQLIRLCGASPWLAAFLAAHPVLLDELLYPADLSGPPDPAALRAELDKRLGRVDPGDEEALIEALCIFKQAGELRVAAADVTGRLPLMRVSDHLSAIAEAILAQVVEMAWRHLVARHGRPRARLGATACPRGFAVIAYGKLGGLELGYGSDLDLVFLHAGVRGTTEGGPRPIDTGQFYNRLGQRVIHLLTAHTRAGRVYEIDMRLRPSGSAGVLVSHLDAFGDYQLKRAWVFEHQALIKARAICGEPALAEAFEAIRRRVLCLPRRAAELRLEVGRMRERMRRELSSGSTARFDLKQDRGGMVDIEFLVQFLVLLKSRRHPALARWTDTVRLLQALCGAGIIGENTAHLLRHAYLVYRARAHQLGLQQAPAEVPPERFERLRRKVQDIWQEVFGDQG